MSGFHFDGWLEPNNIGLVGADPETVRIFLDAMNSLFFDNPQARQEMQEAFENADGIIYIGIRDGGSVAGVIGAEDLSKVHSFIAIDPDDLNREYLGEDGQMHKFSAERLVLHELMHIAHPELSENEIVAKVNEMLPDEPPRAQNLHDIPGRITETPRDINKQLSSQPLQDPEIESRTIGTEMIPLNDVFEGITFDQLEGNHIGPKLDKSEFDIDQIDGTRYGLQTMEAEGIFYEFDLPDASALSNLLEKPNLGEVDQDIRQDDKVTPVHEVLEP